MSSDRNLTKHHGHVSAEDRGALLHQRGVVIWLTGLSGSGKSTTGYALERALVASGHLAYVLDGDNVRHGLNSDLGFAASDRAENIRRIGEVSALFADAGVVAIASFISPYRADRAKARDTAGADRFVEVFLDVPIAVCEQRDPKGLYKKARAGEITDFTGVSAPYEAPESPELTIDTSTMDPDGCAAAIIDCLKQRGFLS